MHYPFWYVPGLTSPMLIALVAVLHVYVSMYAVGGGFVLAAETRHAYRVNDAGLLRYLRDHTWFFILLTVVYGAITGVGIWWTIGLASPLATEALIHIFVFAWAIEWITFIIEIVAAFIFFYYWGRLPARTHEAIGWIYAGAAWLSLVIITGITAFMMNSGSWPAQGGFWRAFFNPQTLPQILARTGGSLLLASLYFYLHASFRLKEQPECCVVETRISRYAMAGAVLVLLGGAGWYLNVPASGRAALVGASALNLLQLLIFAITAIVFILMYVGPYRNPGWLTPGFAILFFGLGLAAVGTGEFIREAVRKPYIVYGVVYGHGVYPSEIPELQQNGFVESGVWTRAWIASNYPELLDSEGHIDEAEMLTLPVRDQQEIGRMVFMYHCNDCHAIDGYSGVSGLARGWTPEMVELMVRHLDDFHYFMPPWSGTDAEAEVLAVYLESVIPPHPFAR
ncbi:MAG: hypothetical protein D6791_13775 [Chloroflexi bacterium]|nr:MAG: hypothetical protein D6791_13775 [Chloroflexota bacterium]